MLQQIWIEAKSLKWQQDKLSTEEEPAEETSEQLLNDHFRVCSPAASKFKNKLSVSDKQYVYIACVCHIDHMTQWKRDLSHSSDTRDTSLYFSKSLHTGMQPLLIVGLRWVAERRRLWKPGHLLRLTIHLLIFFCGAASFPSARFTFVSSAV